MPSHDPTDSSDEAPALEWEARILALFDAPKAQPLTPSELARHLEVPPPERAELREALRNLESQGKVERLKKGRFGLPKPAGTTKANSRFPEVTGTIQFPAPRRNRNAVFEPDPASARTVRELTGEDRIFVPERFSGTALPGDRVRATLHPADAPSNPRAAKRHRDRHHRASETRHEARVREVMHRHRTRFVGLLHHDGRFAHVEPDQSVIPKNIEVQVHALPRGAENGQKVVVELVEWTNAFEPPRGRVVSILGQASDPGVDVLSIIHRYELPQAFPAAVVREAEAIPQSIPEDEITRREDWRDAPVFTIDPVDAKDFDDAILVRELADGWELGVFIADVAHYVEAGSKLDKEARERGNSVYLVDRVIPMLPEALSNGICSLVPHQDRLTHAVILEFDRRGKRRATRFCKAVINSKRRFSYEEAFALLDAETAPADPADAFFHEKLRIAWDLGSVLRRRRMDHGSLDLDFPEIRVVLEPGGRPKALEIVLYDISHQLIEEFMLAANESVAEFIKNRQAAGIYRVHEDPDTEKLYEFGELARAYAYKTGDLTVRTELQKLLAEIRGKPEEHALKIGLLKSLKRAVYSEEPMGHYGLAKANYTHFTSPIRRYADLVVHRVLEQLATRPRRERSLPRQKDLAEIAEHISQTERTAADAESESKLLKQFEYFFNLTRENQQETFQAIITEIMPRGLFVELKDFFLRGMVRREDLPREYSLEPRFQRVTDHRGKVVLHPGLTIPVHLRRVDIEQKHLDFTLAE